MAARFHYPPLLVAGILLLLLSSPAANAGEAAPDTAGSVIDTEAAWRWISTARDAAQQDQHHEAVADYLEALADDASLVQIVAKEIAYQKLWREDADKAIFYFRRFLARNPDRENRDVRRGLAMAYSWSGRQKEAIGLYRQLVSEDPSDGSSRVGLGRCLIWNNQLEEGFDILRETEDGFPADSAASREAGDFILTYLDSYTTPLDLTTTASWDSDDLDTYRMTASGAFTVLGNKLALVSPALTLFQQPGHADITAPRIGLGLVGTLAHNWAFHAYGWLDFFRSREPLFGRPEKLDWTRPGGDIWLTWLPAPRWRVDFGGNSTAVETFYALDRHIHYEQANLSTDWRFARHFTAGVAGNLADYSDGNSKRRMVANLRWRREGKWEFQVGPDFTYMDFTMAYPGGYWSPDWVRNASLAFLLKTRGRRMTWQINASIGQEQETGADAITVGGASSRVGWRFRSGALLAAEIGYSRSSLTTDSGYNRTFAALSYKATF